MWSWICSCCNCQILLTQIELKAHIMSRIGGWAWRCGGEDAILFSLSPTHSVPTAHILKHTCSIHSSEIRDSVLILGFWSYLQRRTVLRICDGMFSFSYALSPKWPLHSTHPSAHLAAQTHSRCRDFSCPWTNTPHTEVGWAFNLKCRHQRITNFRVCTFISQSHINQVREPFKNVLEDFVR